MYERRLLLYIDLLGWSAQLERGAPETLLKAVQLIHREAEDFNERTRKELESLEGQTLEIPNIGLVGPLRINPMRLRVQFGAFSDHFVFSLPTSFGGRVLEIASRLIIDLLRAGFPVRGAVVIGDLYHCDNMIFGPALLQAVRMEEQEAFFPRVLLEQAVVNMMLAKDSTYDHRCKSMLTDQTGRAVVNPFFMPFDGPDEITESFVKENFHLEEIKSLLANQIDKLENQGRYRHAEKWRYLRQFIEGPVLEALPKLRRFWS